MKQQIDLKPWLEHLSRHVAIARRGADPEGVHQLRIAVAHIRVWLELGRWRVLQDDLRWLRAKTAPVRDLDVQLGREVPEGYARELRAERARAHRALVVALGECHFESLLAALEVLPPLRVGRVRRGVAGFAARTLAFGLALPRGDHACVHAVRRSVRRLRFALEWLGEPSGDIVELQDALGVLCDAWVAVRHARHHGKGDEMREHRRALKRELRSAARMARRAFGRTRPALEALV